MMSTKYIPPDEMESITARVLHKSDISTLWNGYIEKIDIDHIIEFVYGLDIVWEDIDMLDVNGIILAAIKPSEKLIIMNESKKDLFKVKMGTMNFSKAHELGHWVLHVTKQEGYEQSSSLSTEFYCRNLAKKPPKEVQADMFAASLLMPKEIISEAINELKHKGFVTFPELYKMADNFEVSISALTNRINVLDLLCIRNKKIYLSVDEMIEKKELS